MNRKTIFVSVFAASILAAACLGIAKSVDHRAGSADAAERLDGRTARAMAGDELFGPAYISIDRSDVTWQESRVADPDNIRAF